MNYSLVLTADDNRCILFSTQACRNSTCPQRLPEPSFTSMPPYQAQFGTSTAISRRARSIPSSRFTLIGTLAYALMVRARLFPTIVHSRPTKRNHPKHEAETAQDLPFFLVTCRAHDSFHRSTTSERLNVVISRESSLWQPDGRVRGPRSGDVVLEVVGHDLGAPCRAG